MYNGYLFFGFFSGIVILLVFLDTIQEGVFYFNLMSLFRLNILSEMQAFFPYRENWQYL